MPNEFKDDPQNNESRVFQVSLIFAITFLAGLPVARGYLRDYELPRWYVASAANSFRRENLSEATAALDHAVQLQPKIVQDADYWRLRFDILNSKADASDKDYEQFVEQVIQLKATLPPSESFAIAMVLGSQLLENGHAQASVRLLNAVSPPRDKRSAIVNNQLAYARAIAGEDLPTALLEIEAAIRKSPKRVPSYLDTKAWILYGLGDYETAYDLANDSVILTYAEISTQSQKIAQAMVPDKQLRELKELAENEGIAAAKLRLAEWNAGAEIAEGESVASLRNMLAVLRYHRASILERLGRTDDAGLDRFWLRLMGIKEEDKLI